MICIGLVDDDLEHLRFIRRNTQQSIVLQPDDSIVKIITPDILYIEKDKNYLVYYTRAGNYRVKGTMTALSDTLLQAVRHGKI